MSGHPRLNPLSPSAVQLPRVLPLFKKYAIAQGRLDEDQVEAVEASNDLWAVYTALDKRDSMCDPTFPQLLHHASR